MFFHGVDKEEPRKGGDKDGGKKGDGLHHHEIHEDEGGGYTSKHTDPEGNVEHGDHVDYDDAREDQDRKFGRGDSADDNGEDRDENEGEDDGGDMSLDDIAGSYGRASSDN